MFAADLQALRPQPGQAVAAANMRALLADSPIVASHAGPDCAYVQDAYSMRCAPQVAGAGAGHARARPAVAGYELAAAVDNPVRDAWTAGSSPTATSTAHRSATCWTSWPSRPPTSPR